MKNKFKIQNSKSKLKKLKKIKAEKIKIKKTPKITNK